ncbi:MAG: hypothetical protein B7X11_04845, partial [Acidobacteria bacterium 37-65-4]
QSGSAASDVDRTQLNNEFQDVLSEIDREAGVAKIKSGDASLAFSVFVSAGADGLVTGTIGAADKTTLGIGTQTITTAALAATAVDKIATAVTSLGASQGTIGALQNRLQFAISLSQSQTVSTRAAESRIRDANMAEESANMTRFNILSQSGIAALAQANQQSSSILTLLR